MLLNHSTLIYSPEFPPYIVEIISFSFTEEYVSFDKFLETFKTGCDKHYDKMITCEFTNLLQSLQDKTFEMSNNYFGDLNQYSEVLKRAFLLFREGKVDSFELELSRSIVEGG